MAIVVRNTNYNGEVLEKILTLAATGNEIVEKGMIYVIPGVEKKSAFRVSRAVRCCRNVRKIPRLKTRKATSITVRNHWIRWILWPSQCLTPSLRTYLAQVAAERESGLCRTPSGGSECPVGRVDQAGEIRVGRSLYQR